MKENVRAAIYTRVSLNSQSTAAQVSELSEFVERRGWLGKVYNDAGQSGVKKSRPELERMLADVRRRRIDVVVIWSLDRLARSLKQLLTLSEEFRELGVDLVAHQQNLDSSTASGRLMFSMLGAISEFERELLRERVLCGLAEARRSGKRLGRPPSKYLSHADVELLRNGRREGKSFRVLAREFGTTGSQVHSHSDNAGALRLGCVPKLKAFLDANKIHGKQNRPFSRGALYHVLNNRIYLGEIVHRKQIYQGQHQGIINPELWEKVATTLKANDPVPNKLPRATESSPLAGLLFDAAGVRYTPTHSVKNGKRYRYYTSQSVIQHKEPVGIARIPARELERVVEARIQTLLSSPRDLVQTLNLQRSERLKSLAQRRAQEWAKLDINDKAQVAKSVLKRVVLLTDCVEIELSYNQLKAALIGEGSRIETVSRDRRIRLNCEIQIKHRGGEVRIIGPAGEMDDKAQSPSVLKGVIRARQWYERIVRGDVSSFEELARQNRVTDSYVRRMFRLATLAPEIVESLVNNRNRHLTLESFRRQFPLDWAEQRRAM